MVSEGRRPDKLQGEGSLEGTGEGEGEWSGVPAGLLRFDAETEAEADLVVDDEKTEDAARALR